MKLPERVNASWIASLADAQLLQAEGLLHAEFQKEQLAEKKRVGAKYDMMRGPESLMSAWQRWLMVSNEMRARGVLLHRRPKSA